MGFDYVNDSSSSSLIRYLSKEGYKMYFLNKDNYLSLLPEGSMIEGEHNYYFLVTKHTKSHSNYSKNKI